MQVCRSCLDPTGCSIGQFRAIEDVLGRLAPSVTALF
jgi:hypothetical protein